MNKDGCGHLRRLDARQIMRIHSLAPQADLCAGSASGLTPFVHLRDSVFQQPTQPREPGIGGSVLVPLHRLLHRRDRHRQPPLTDRRAIEAGFRHDGTIDALVTHALEPQS
ncbi:hypothetical protein [Burkholderia multivorans]|uniref:hypothetical protein n=1 Tax=Burkholderia multivorans TaxID=87883 RepID=UPI003BFA23A9